MSRKVIAFGNQRIFADNIKDYGIAKKTAYLEKVYDIECQVRGKVFVHYERNCRWNGDLVKVDKSRYEDCVAGYSNYILVNTNEGIKESSNYAIQVNTRQSVICNKVKYLYVTTYDNKNYTFIEGSVNFNIYQKCKELDNYFDC